LNACYKLQFDAGLWQSIYTVNTASTAHVAFFTEHFPTEFESDAHYLKDDHGDDIEPVAELPEAAAPSPPPSSHDDHDDAEWGASLLSAILVNIVTLVGVILAVPALNRLYKENAAVLDGVLFAFAAGALLACAFFLLLFEATHLVGEGWTEEVDTLWRWGTMVLAGFLLPSVLQNVVEWALVAGLGGAETKAENAGNDKEAGAEGSGTALSMSQKARIIGGVTIGDFLHNFCDGIFIGAAFKGCGTSFGWGVSLSTVLHEFPQELADYAILTQEAGLKPVIALALNFLAGMSVILGVVIINASDVENSSVGLLLAFGGGTYVYLAASECMPKLYSLQLSAKTNLLCLISFIVGATLIGLILLDHEHCVPDTGSAGEGGGGGHGHHGHGH